MDRRLQKIIKKCLKNDRRAQFELYHQCFDHLMRTCVRYKRNREDAVSLLNDGFLKILLKLHTYNQKQEFFPWISTIMVRTAIDDYRKNRSYNSETDFKGTDHELEEASFHEISGEIVDKLSLEELNKMIFSLPEEQRLVFSLYEWEGYQHREIAAKMAISERSSKRYLKQAKMSLRKQIEKSNDIKKVI